MESASKSNANPFTGKVFSPRYHQLAKERARLPINECKGQFEDAFAECRVVLINDKAGSGASSEIPHWAAHLASSTGKPVVCTQPFRLAAVSLATRVADEMHVELGLEVGFSIRDEQRGGRLLKYCSDGWLLREAERDPLLSDYSVIVVDGVHERTLNVDVLIGKLKGLLSRRDDVTIVVIGVELDVPKWTAFFDTWALLTAPRQPVPTIVYSPQPTLNHLDAAVETVIGLHASEKEGDFLLYLATPEEVQRVCEEIGRRETTIDCIPLHSQLPFDETKRLHAPSKGRKCVVSTNIGESGFIFDDSISIVVDGGRRLSEVYDAVTRVESTQVVRISKANARRRAERWGVKKVVRLFSEDKFGAMEEERLSEILRTDPERLKEMLKNNGVNKETFEFLDKPTLQ